MDAIGVQQGRPRADARELFIDCYDRLAPLAAASAPHRRIPWSSECAVADAGVTDGSVAT